jgi:hypothetical protein
MPFSNATFRLLVCSAMVLSLLGLNASAALGQGSSTPGVANITTIVFDPTGAVIPNAEVTFKGEKTITTTTRQDGSSVQMPLPYGRYAVAINSPGFKTSVIDYLVDTDKPRVLKVVLAVAPTTGNYALVEGVPTTTSDLPYLIQPTEAMNLPMGGGPSTFFPPSVYTQFFSACSSDRACTRSEKFRVDSVPRGCCVLTVTNGDGHGTDEVSTYLVFLNGKRVLPAGHTQHSSSVVKVHQDNILKVVLTGEPYSKVFIQIAYDPRL